MNSTDIHIGRAIEQRIRELGLVKKHVAEKMAMSQQNLNSIFKSEHIRTDQLEGFCILLEKNFFLLYRGYGDINEFGDKRNIQINIDPEGHLYDSNTSKKLDAIYREMSNLKDQIKEVIELKAICKKALASKNTSK